MKQKIESLLRDYCDQVGHADLVVELTRPDSQFGDFSTNIALQLAKPLGRSPREVAGDIQVLLQDNGIVCEIAGPGFLNMTLPDSELLVSLSQDVQRPYTGQTILVEYSNPNPLKPLHAGHLYTTLVGDVIARLIERAGARTVRLNYGGDVGLHVAKSMWAILNRLVGALPEQLEAIPADTRALWLGECYVEGNNAYEDNEQAKEQITDLNKQVYHLHETQDTESPFARIYWTVRSWSYDYFDQ
jgi:arginyl-tRNA synthetase